MHSERHEQRIDRPAAVGMVLLVCLVWGAAGHAQPERQILRPRQEGAETTILQTDRVVRLVLQLPVEPGVAYDAWTDANQLVQWLPQWAEMQVTEGGTFEIGWDGYEGVWSGTYVEVERPERLAFTWLPPETSFPGGAYQTLVTLTFEEGETGGTVMTLEHSGFRGIDEMEAQLEVWRPYMFALRAFVLRPPSVTG